MRSHIRRYDSPAKTYYYDEVGGLDTNIGSADSPRKTIGHINSFSFKPGDRICFKRGITFNDADLVVPVGGSRRRPITFTDYGAGALPIIQLVTNACIFINNKENITLRNLDFNGNWGLYGGKLYCSHLLVDNCTFRSTSGSAPGQSGEGGVGISIEDNGVNKHDIIIINCTMTNNMGYAGMSTDPESSCTRVLIRNCNSSNNGSDTAYHHGIYLRGWANISIENCITNNNSGVGIALADCINIVVDKCTSNDNNWGISGGGSGTSVFRNNSIYSNTAIGINCSASYDKFEVYNNTIVNNVIGLYVRAGVTGSVIKNNIMVETISGQPLFVGGANEILKNTFDHNSYYRSVGTTKPINVSGTFYTLAEWKAFGGSPDVNGIGGNPLFVTDHTDLHLQSGSACRNAGTLILGIDSDKDGVTLDAIPDIGCYQYVA